MHASRVEPHEEGLVRGVGAINEVEARGEKLPIGSLHALAGHGTRVLDLAVSGRANDAARTILFAELWIFRVEVSLGFFFSIQVIEVAKELVEAVCSWQVLVLVAEVVFAVLGSHVALVFHQRGNCRCPLWDAVIGAGHTNGQETGAEGVLAVNKRGTTSGAALLSVSIGKQSALFGKTVDVGRLVAHNAVVVGTDVMDADIVTPNHEDVGLISCDRGPFKSKAEQRGGNPCFLFSVVLVLGYKSEIQGWQSCLCLRDFELFCFAVVLARLS